MNFTHERVVAIVRLIVMLVTAALGGFGLTVDADSLYTIALCGIAFVAAIISWWKNNNITKAAGEAQDYLNNLKLTGGR